MNENNLFGIQDSVTRVDREAHLNQRGRVIWFTGLSGAGKSTIAKALNKELFQKGYFCQMLDGDNIRSGINNNLGFSDEDRKENIRRIAEVSKLFVDSGVITINSFITPTPIIRDIPRRIIGKPDLIEVFINSPLYVCEQRDVKGLYKMAREGKLKNFTGIDSPFIPPKTPDITIDTANFNVEECVKGLLDFLVPLLKL